MQERLGALLYLATSTRADIAYAVPLLCRAMSRPTPELIEETDYVLAYLALNPSLGLTYSPSPDELLAHSDASWEVRHSTSGWVVHWQGAAIACGAHANKIAWPYLHARQRSSLSPRRPRMWSTSAS